MTRRAPRRSSARATAALLHLSVLAMLVVASTPVSAGLFGTVSVDVDPPAPVLPSDDVSLEISIEFPTAPGFIFKPTEVSIVGNAISVDVFATTTCWDLGGLGAACPAVVSVVEESVALGTLAPGVYDWDVSGVLRALGFESEFDSASGSFTVTPEPGTSLLVALGLAAVGVRRQRLGG